MCAGPVLSGNYFKSSINPPPRGGAYLFQAHSKGRGWGLIESGGLFNLEMATISVLHKELEYKVQSESNPKLQLVNKLFRISPHEILIIRGWEGGLLTFFSSKERGGGGVLIEALRYKFNIFYFHHCRLKLIYLAYCVVEGSARTYAKRYFRAFYRIQKPAY